MLTLTGQLLAGKYRVGPRLGGGGMGEVYEGLQEDLGRPVAIKVMMGTMASDPQLLQRFQREARAVAALGHPHIVAVTDFQDNPGEPPFLVMERLVGESLGDLLEREPMLDPARACRITEQTLWALAAAHEAGLVHRDVKPDNIFLCKTNAGGGELVKLLDFGVAKALEETQHGKLTSTGAIVGTLVYMAPEQARGEPVDARADLYAMGAVLYHMLAGQTPFQTTSGAARLLNDVASSRPMPLASLRPDLDGALLAIVARAMEPAAAYRYPDARSMMAALGALLRGEAPRTEPVMSHAATALAPKLTPPYPITQPKAPYKHPTSGAGVVLAPYVVAGSAPPPPRSHAGIIAALMGVFVLAFGATAVGYLYLHKSHASVAKTAPSSSGSVELVAAVQPGGDPSLAGLTPSATPTVRPDPFHTVPTSINTAPVATTTAVSNPALAGMGTGQLIQQMVAAHTRGDGKTCLDAWNKLQSQPDFSDPSNGYAIIHGDCLMAAGRCDEGRKMIRDWYSSPRPALQQLSPTQVDTSVSQMALTYCPLGQLSPAERVSRAQQLYYKAEGSHDTAAAARYADEMAAQLPSVPRGTEDERRKLKGYEYTIGKAYGDVGRCNDARAHFYAQCMMSSPANADACANSLLRNTASCKTP